MLQSLEIHANKQDIIFAVDKLHQFLSLVRESLWLIFITSVDYSAFELYCIIIILYKYYISEDATFFVCMGCKLYVLRRFRHLFCGICHPNSMGPSEK